MLVHALVLNAVIVAVAAARLHALPTDPSAALLGETVRLSTDGFWLSVAILPAVAVSLLVLALLVRLRRGPALASTLALLPAPWNAYLAWNGVLILLLGAMAALDLWFRRPVPEWVLAVFDTAGSPALLVLALGLVGPLFEEALFRGFLFRSWLPSRLGPAGTILATSLLWTAIHVQYAPYEMAQVFAAGLVLGAARARSGSLFVPFSMHALMNLAALAQLVLLRA